ncbi:hypothetical protein [Aeromonas caviae]|uniref:hypothetical protein n=1 Tax=Aeromonas caviae TaxID=648 RepID=UPI0029DDAFFB|nr:hypothetical protein [Aeromonas caviae]MDX7853086.1 hypothetical protein [Aeromonas caviae]
MTTDTKPSEDFELPERSLKKLRNDDIHEALQKMTTEGMSLRKIRAFVADHAALKISAERLGTYLKETFDYESPRSKALAEKNRGG